MRFSYKGSLVDLKYLIDTKQHNSSAAQVFFDAMSLHYDRLAVEASGKVYYGPSHRGAFCQFHSIGDGSLEVHVSDGRVYSFVMDFLDCEPYHASGSFLTFDWHLVKTMHEDLFVSNAQIYDISSDDLAAWTRPVASLNVTAKTGVPMFEFSQRFLEDSANDSGVLYELDTGLNDFFLSVRPEQLPLNSDYCPVLYEVIADQDHSVMPKDNLISDAVNKYTPSSPTQPDLLSETTFKVVLINGFSDFFRDRLNSYVDVYLANRLAGNSFSTSCPHALRSVFTSSATRAALDMKTVRESIENGWASGDDLEYELELDSLSELEDSFYATPLGEFDTRLYSFFFEEASRVLALPSTALSHALAHAEYVRHHNYS